MEFGFSQEQQEVQQLARKILSDQVTPVALSEFDEYRAPRFDSALWQQLATAGLSSVCVQQRYGGMGFGFMELALFIEEVGRTSTGNFPLRFRSTPDSALRQRGYKGGDTSRCSSRGHFADSRPGGTT